MSKLSFRARALDASRPMAVFLGDELPDLPDHSAISRAVPAMPTGMEKDEECEHHLQRAICAGLIIPTPEVSDMSDVAAYDRLYPSDYNKPRQLIHMQPLGLEQEVPDYDMDSEDEKWLRRQHAAAGGRASELTELKFEETMEKLERGSGQTVVTLREARALAGRTGPADHILAAVYDYWLNKRLATQQPLLLAVRTEPRPGAPQASPYLAFRRRTEKMQTRKNRKNDESSYEKMVKLRRELTQVVSLLDLIRQRERLKRDGVRVTAAVVEKRYSARDFNGCLFAEATAARAAVATTLIVPPYTASHHRPPLDSAARQREKRQYKRRKHRHHSSLVQSHAIHHVAGMSGSSSSSEGEGAESSTVPPPESSGPFTFRRKPGCQYHMPANNDSSEEVPWMTESSKENTNPGRQDPKLRYVLASVNSTKSKCVGFVRRRMGRGGRVILDRLSCPALDDRLWESLGYTVTDSNDLRTTAATSPTPCHNDFIHSSKPASVDNLPIKIECETSRSTSCSDPNFRFNPVNQVYEEVKVKSEMDLSRLFPHQDHSEKVISSPDKFSNDLTEVKIKSELDVIEFSDSEKLSRLDLSHRETIRDQVSNTECVDGSSDSDSLSSCDEHDYYNSKFSFKGSTPDRGKAFKKYRDKNIKARSARKTTSSMYREDMKVMAELLVSRRLARCEQRVPDMSSPYVDNFLKDVWGDRLHFKPKPPDPDVNLTTCRATDQEEEGEQLTEHSPITVHVRLALPDLQQPPSDLLFNDASTFVTSEFTLADIYGDSIINPNPDIDMPSVGEEQSSKSSVTTFKDVPWSHTNGPIKLERNLPSEDGGNITDSVDELSPTKVVFKAEPSENSSSNQTSVFLSSEGGPPSAASVNSDTVAFGVTEDSNHEATNGVTSEWNDSNESDKLKQLQKKTGNGLANKCKPTINLLDSGNIGTSTAIKVEPLLNNQRLYLDSDRPSSPSFPLASQQSRVMSSNSSAVLSPISMDVVDQKKIEVQNQNLAIVQLRTPGMLSNIPQSKVKQVFKSVLTSDGAEVRAPLLVTSRQSGSPVRKTDTGRVHGVEDMVPVSRQQQQLVTLAMADSIKLRLPGHLLGGGGSSTTTSSAHDILGLVHSKTLPPSALPRDGIATGARRAVLQVAGGTGRAVRFVHTRPLSPSQRSRILTPGPLQLRGIANLLQLQVRTPNRRPETLEPVQQPTEAASAGSATAGTGGDAGPAPSGPAPAAGPPPAPGKPPPPPSPRKGQASLPMEVT